MGPRSSAASAGAIGSGVLALCALVLLWFTESSYESDWSALPADADCLQRPLFSHEIGLVPYYVNETLSWFPAGCKNTVSVETAGSIRAVGLGLSCALSLAVLIGAGWLIRRLRQPARES